MQFLKIQLNFCHSRSINRIVINFSQLVHVWRARYVFFRAVSIFNSLLMLIRLIIDKQLFMVSRKHIGREKVSRSEISTNWWTWYQVRWGRNIDLICGKSSKFQEIHGFIGWAGKSINFDFFQQFAISTPCHYFFLWD